MNRAKTIEKIKILQELSDRKKFNQLQFYTPYPKQLEFHEAESSERMLGAGNQCITPWTYIETEHGARPALEVLASTSETVLSWDGEIQCNKLMTGGFLKSISQAFRVVLGNGEFFDCTHKHQVLTTEGYISLDQLVLLSSGRRYKHKLEDYQANCVEGGYLCDQSPHQRLSIDQEQPPSSAYVHKRVRFVFSLEDVKEHIFQYNHACPQFSRLSNSDAQPHLAALFEKFSASCVYSNVLPLTQKNQEYLQLCSELPAEPLSIPEEGFCYHDQIEILYPYSHPELVGGAKIIAVVPIGYQPIIDGTVEDTSCYFAAGVIHHNTGKTYSGSKEAAYHATGLYPDWWKGQRFNKPNVGWVGGVSGEVIRDTTQKLLVGRMQDEDSIGSGAIPKAHINKTVKALGVKDLLDHVKVKHVSGGTSLIFFKSYEKGREKFQGETIDWVWLDEEPPADIYSECLTRTNNGQLGQFIFITFTPLKGMTTIAYDYYSRLNPMKHLTTMTIWDVGHYTEEDKVKIVASYPDHEREARSKGIPTVGEGRVFLTPEDDIKHSDESYPQWFPHIVGMDFGYGQSEAAHPSALVYLAWDRDRDIINIYDAFYVKQPTPIKVAGAIRGRSDSIDWMPVAWPHDAMKASGGNEKGTIAELHKNQGMQMLDHHATFEDGGNSVEAGLLDMQQRFDDGRLKVAAHLSEWFDEYRMYHRENGKIVKLRDDLMSATRYGIMSLRFAETEPTDEYEEYHDNADYGPGGY